MEPDRFDDVELQVLEEPVPRGPRRGTRWAIGLVASVLTAGALAAGASALTGSSDEAVRPAAKPRLQTVHSDAAVWRAAHPCRDHARSTTTASAPRD